MQLKDNKAAQFRELEEKNTSKRAKLLGLGYVDSRLLKDLPLVPNILAIREMYENAMVPLKDEGENKHLIFGITINTPQPILRELRSRFLDRQVQYLMMSNPGYKELIARYDPPKAIHYDDIAIASEGDSGTLKQVSATLETVRSEDIFDYLIGQGIKLKASDIHIETARHNVRIRMRVDGALHIVAYVSHEKYRTLEGTIASRADVSIDSPDAQTGHIIYPVIMPDGTEKILNMRIETVPTVFGQDAVLRLFELDESMFNLDKLHFSKEQRANVDDVIVHPHGLMLMVGPTGSGKSTTLYSIIKVLNDPQRKIITLEDPVEFAIEGVSQIPVASRKGASFADKFRAVMRLDPDVIMVGEIRDVDTAKTAIQASVTGHLILSTFHATDAATALSRMLDMIGQNAIFANSIKMVMAQRLVRRLDQDTKIPFEPDEGLKNYIRENLKELPDYIEKPDLDHITLYKPGITDDSPFGYKGRIVIAEQLLMNDELQKMIRVDANQLDTDQITEVAKRNGMLTMLQDGLLKALRGETTLEEINRVL